MNFGDKLELGIFAFIVVGFAIAIWKGGAANPISTGRLQRDLTSIKAKVGELEKSAKGTAKASDVAQLRGEMERGKEERTQTMKQLHEKIDKVADELDDFKGNFGQRLAGVEATTKVTAHQVDMMFQVIVPKGMS